MTELSPDQNCPLTPSKSTVVKGETFWLAVFESMEGAPKIDFGKLAERCGYKNAATARVMFNNKRKALQQTDPPVSPTKHEEAPVDGTKPKRGRKPKPKEGTEGNEPPKKRGRGRPKKSEMIEPVPAMPVPEMMATTSSNSGDEEADTDVGY